MRRVFLWLAVLVMAASTASAADNKETARQIAGNLRNSGRLQGYNIAVKVSSGSALLKGTVRSEADKARAEEIALNTPGIERVTSELAVSGGRAPLAGRTARPGVLAASHVEGTATPLPTSPAPRAQTATRAPQALALNNAGSYSGEVVEGYAGDGGYTGPMPIGDGGAAPMAYDNANMPNYAWPSYAAYPNYAAVSYPKQYSASAWPYIGPFYPYPQVPLGWRKVTMEWKDGWWWLDFKDRYRWH